MHTARQLDPAAFAVEIDGTPATREQLLPGWHAHDRFGLVLDEPFGAVGASLLLQLAISAFYAVRPSRREAPPIYPEVYLFHAGGRHGDHAYYDVFPPRKEVFVDDDPAAVLEAINDRAITRLAVVDGPVEAVRHRWKEPVSAHDRIASAFAYAPGGRVAGADVAIAALDRRATANTKMALHPTRTYAEQARIRAAMGPLGDVPDDEQMQPEAVRHAEVPEQVRDRIAAQREQISVDGLPRETYRRVSTGDALGMLHRRAAR